MQCSFLARTFRRINLRTSLGELFLVFIQPLACIGFVSSGYPPSVHSWGAKVRKCAGLLLTVCASCALNSLVPGFFYVLKAAFRGGTEE